MLIRRAVCMIQAIILLQAFSTSRENIFFFAPNAPSLALLITFPVNQSLEKNILSAVTKGLNVTLSLVLCITFHVIQSLEIYILSPVTKGLRSLH